MKVLVTAERTLMTFLHQMDVHQSRCQEQLLRLRMLARTWDGAAVPQEVAAEIRDATNVIIAEAEAMTRAAIRDHRRQEPQAETFLWVRITRLAAAGGRAVDAARSRDVSGLRVYLNHFDTLTSALWAVRDAVYSQRPVPGPRSPACPWPARDHWVPHHGTVGRGRRS